MRDDVEENFRSVLKNGLAKLDLVTREEFEVQEALLERAREQHAKLEARLSALEAKLGATEAAAVATSAEAGTKKKARKKSTRKKKPPE